MNSDLVEVLEAIRNRRLREITLNWDRDASICVILAAGGYPGDFEKGKVIKGLAEAEALPGVKVFHGGTENRNGRPVSNSGRVLGVTAKATSLNEAIPLVYQAVQCIQFDQMHYRRDIGRKGLRKELLQMKTDR
jgi:phosphoribosylamine--glycine ligase